MAISNSASGFRPGVCTSTTRPVSPFNGQVIYETDSKQTLVWQGTAWVMLTDADSPPAMELIKTQTIGTTVSSVTVTNTFSSTYDNYMVAISDVTASVGGGVFVIKLCVGSTPQTNGWYGNTFYVAAGQSSGLSNATFNNSSYAEICSMTSTTNHKNAGMAYIQSPFLTQQTRLQYTNADDYYFRTGAFHLSNTTSYDGLQILPSSGTITGGTIRVYGYRNTI